MKNKILFGAIGISLLLLTSGFAVWRRYRANTRFELPHGYRWRIASPNKMIICNNRGETLIGPGWISLWGRYPYIYGTCEGERFVINTRRGDLERFISCRDFERRLKQLSLPLLNIDSFRANLYDFIYDQGNTTRADNFRRAILPPGGIPD